MVRWQMLNVILIFYSLSMYILVLLKLPVILAMYSMLLVDISSKQKEHSGRNDSI